MKAPTCISILVLFPALLTAQSSLKVTNSTTIYKISLSENGRISLEARKERQPTLDEIADEAAAAVHYKNVSGRTMPPRQYYDTKSFDIPPDSVARVQKALAKFEEWSEIARKEKLPSAEKVIDDIQVSSSSRLTLSSSSRLTLKFGWGSRPLLWVSTGKYSIDSYFEANDVAEFRKLLDEVPKLEEQSAQVKGETEKKKAEEEAQKKRVDSLLK